MNIVTQSYEIITSLEPNDVRAMLSRLEEAGRVCYKTEDRIIPGFTAGPFIQSIIRRGHESVIEHEYITVVFITDRGVTHELVRHRVGIAFSQESTRYCNYKDKDIEFIIPCNINNWTRTASEIWYEEMEHSELSYKDMIREGLNPQDARSILPNSLKTEIRVTANLREWRHIFKLRTAAGAHPQMINLIQPLKIELADKLPDIFGDLL